MKADDIREWDDAEVEARLRELKEELAIRRRWRVLRCCCCRCALQRAEQATAAVNYSMYGA